MSQDTLKVELEIKDGNAEVVIGKNRRLLEDFVADVNKAEPKVKFSIPNQTFIDLDKLEKRAAQTRKSFEEVAKVRLDAGQSGFLTKEIVRASERARQLQSDISSIKRELANPNRKSSIAFLTDELRAAEAEAERLNKKLNSLPGNVSQGGGIYGRSGSNNLKLTSFQKQNLSYQVNDVLTMAAMGANPTQILASQGGQIAQIFNPAQITAFTAAYGGLVAILGVGTLAIAATYKITGDIRKEAERRLKTEEMITGAINKQRIAQKEVLDDLKKAEENAARNREFNRALATNSDEQLNSREATARRLLELNPLSENTGRYKQEILDIQAQRETNKQTRMQLAAASFDQRFEDFKKSEEDAIKFEEKRRAEAEKKKREFEQDVEKAKNQVKEFEKQYLSTFDQIFQKTGAQNPIFTAFNEGNRALEDLKENLRGLPPEVQAVARALQEKLNLKARLEAGLNNQLSVLDLRQDAQNFRNPFDQEKQRKEQDQFLARFFFNNPNFAFLNNIKPVQDVKDLPPEVRESILKRFGAPSLAETPQDRLNKSFDERFNTLYKPRQSALEQAVADKLFIGLTNGANPLDLSRENRIRASDAREREATRQERYQVETVQLQKDQLAIQKQIAENTKRQMEKAEKGGTKAIEVTVKDDTSGGVKSNLKPAASNIDTSDAYYDPDLSFYNQVPRGGRFSNR